MNQDTANQSKSDLSALVQSITIGDADQPSSASTSSASKDQLNPTPVKKSKKRASKTSGWNKKSNAESKTKCNADCSAAQGPTLTASDTLEASPTLDVVPALVSTSVLPKSNIIVAAACLDQGPGLSSKRTVITDDDKAMSRAVHFQYDKIWGMIEISKTMKTLSEHPMYKRMARIKQLGPLHYKFKYADHNRYEHSLGCAYLARLAAMSLRQKHIDITEREVLCVELAGGFHDIGHGPFSHSYDALLHDMRITHPTAHHETRSQILTKYVLEDYRAQKLEHCDLTDDEISLIQYFIDPEKYQKYQDPDLSKLPKFYKGLEGIVSNPYHKVDIDKMDYLMRDAFELRFDQTLNPNLDVLGTLRRAMIVAGVWSFHIRDQGIIHNLICRRFIFYTNNYLDPEVNAASCMLTRAFRIANNVLKFVDSSKLETKEDIERYCGLTDDYMEMLLLNTKDDRLDEAKQLMLRIVSNKDWYKHISDSVTNITGLDNTTYTELPWSVFTDKSTPTNLLPKVKYHNDGVPIKPEDANYVFRLYHMDPKT